MTVVVTDPLVLNLPLSIKIAVPPRLTCMTTYVLLEQEDWFEPDIAFFRAVVKPGMTMIDIGANFGLYTLSVAKLVGDTGKVWAIEPAQGTARYLRESIAINQFAQVDLLVAAVSSEEGQGFLAHDSNNREELHSLDLSQSIETPIAAGQGEIVPLLSLDGLMARQNHPRIDILKIDAEGHEVEILKGASDFLLRQNPLVMLEVLSPDSRMNLPLVAAFEQAGYQIFRLVSGLDLLLPADPAMIETITPINVYALKPDHDSPWQDYLALTPTAFDPAAQDDRLAVLLGDYWQSLGWSRHFAASWTIWLVTPRARDYARALGWWLVAHQAGRSANDRAGALLLAEKLLADLMERQPDLNIQVSLVRVRQDLGDRRGTFESAMDAAEFWSRNRAIDPAIPVLPLMPFTTENVHFDLDLWINMSIIQLIDRYEGYSTSYRIKRGQMLNDLIVQQPWHTLESERRLMRVWTQ